MRILQKKLQNYIKAGGKINDLVRELDIGQQSISRILKEGATGQYRISTLQILYNHFGCENDEIFYGNIAKLYKPTQSMLGTLFRNKRILLGLSIDDVAYKIKHSRVSIIRFENGDRLPGFQSYQVTELLKLYEFSEQEAQTIKRFIAILRDIVTLVKKYDIANYKSKE